MRRWMGPVALAVLAAGSLHTPADGAPSPAAAGKVFTLNVIDAAKSNRYFRHVLHTGPHAQIVVMTLQPGEEIGLETHPGVDQLIVLVDGQAAATVGGRKLTGKAGDLVAVPAGTAHNVVNSGKTPVHLYTVYTPPLEPDGLIHRTKADALKDEAKKK